MRLYSSLVGNTKVVVLADSSESDAWLWLKMNGLLQHDMVLGDSVALGDMELRLRQVESLRPSAIGLIVVDADADIVRQLVDQGVATLLFSPGRFTLPKNRMDRAASKSWADLQADMDSRQQVTETGDFE